MTNPTCKRCKYEFKAALPEWMATALCDSCQDKVTTYIASSSGPRQAAARIKASRRLYAPAEVPSAGEVLSCEVDFTPEPAPDYDEVAAAALHARFEADRAALGFGDHPAPTRIDPMYEAVERGEREARARFLANPNARGFDG